MGKIIDLTAVRRRRSNSFVKIEGGYWLVDPKTTTPFLRTRIEALLRSNYLRWHKEEKGIDWYRVVGGAEEYSKATELQLGGKS